MLSSLDHEANIASWLRLASLQNLTVKWWRPAPTAHAGSNTSPLLTPENLRPLLSEKTAFVACTHTSNVLGSIHDVKAIGEEVHKIPGAKLCVDGVAYAPHREVDVEALGIDFYAFSWYKVRPLPLPPDVLPQSVSAFFHPQTTSSSGIDRSALTGLRTPYLPTLRLALCATLPKFTRALFPQLHLPLHAPRSRIRILRTGRCNPFHLLIHRPHP